MNKYAFNALFLCVLCYFQLHSLAGQRSDETLVRERLLAFAHQNASEGRPDLLLGKIQHQYPETLKLLNGEDLRKNSSNGTIERKYPSLSIAYYTNAIDGIYFLRIDSIAENSLVTLSSLAPIVIATHAGRTMVFDTLQLSDFTHTGFYSFHGFVQISNLPPAIILSAGPIGSGNCVYFYKLQVKEATAGTNVIRSELIVDLAHVTSFKTDAANGTVNVEYFTNKWDPASITNYTIPILKHAR